jgi:RNA polymerase sigma factor for flagellar operon FliA
MAKTGPEREKLIETYKQTGSIAFRNEAVLAYMDIVKYFVFSLRNMYEGFVDPEDITNEAVLGLMSAIDNFDASRGVKFETYASVVIRGTIIDYIRKSDTVPHRLSHFEKDVEKTFQKLYARFDREPTNEEIAADLQVSVEDVRKYLSRAASYRTTSLDEYISSKQDISESRTDNYDWQIEDFAARHEQVEILAKAIVTLTERERTLVSLYYYEKLTLSNIGEVLEISESRVSQLLAMTIAKLRTFMENLDNPPEEEENEE